MFSHNINTWEERGEKNLWRSLSSVKSCINAYLISVILHSFCLTSVWIFNPTARRPLRWFLDWLEPRADISLIHAQKRGAIYTQAEIETRCRKAHFQGLLHDRTGLAQLECVHADDIISVKWTTKHNGPKTAPIAANPLISNTPELVTPSSD